MTKTHLQDLSQLKLIKIAIKLRILPVNFMDIHHIQGISTHTKSSSKLLDEQNQFLDQEEHEDLIDEIFEVIAEQRAESINDLNSPLLQSLHKFELEQDYTGVMIEPLPHNYLNDGLGLTKNKIHFILRDMEWAIIFWQLSTDMKKIIHQKKQEQNRQAYNQEEESNLSIVIHESSTIPKLTHQSKLAKFANFANFDSDLGNNSLSTINWFNNTNFSLSEHLHNKFNALNQKETGFYSFVVSSEEYKRYIYLSNGRRYYWAEIYYYNRDTDRYVLLSRSSIVFKPQLLQVQQMSPPSDTETQMTYQLYELSNFRPSIKASSITLSSVDVA